METIPWSTIIQIVTFVASLFAVYWKMDKKLCNHDEKITEIRNKTVLIDEFKLEIEKIKLTNTYTTQVVKEILEPITEKMIKNLTDYVDIKIGVMNREIEDIKLSNLEFKHDLKNTLTEFKEHTEKIIEKIVK